MVIGVVWYTSTMARDSSFVWLRPATEMENLLDCAARKGFYTTVVGLTVRSIVPLSDHHIKETLHHMFRLDICLTSVSTTWQLSSIKNLKNYTRQLNLQQNV